MDLYLSHGRIWTGTQKDAKEAQGGNGFESIEVPTNKKAALIDWLNEHWNARSAPEDQPQEAAPVAPVVPEPKTAPVAPRAPVGDLAQQIMELEGADLLNALQASIDRLHETAGLKGWQAFAKHATAWGGKSGVATDRGLGMLVLAGLVAAADKDAT